MNIRTALLCLLAASQPVLAQRSQPSTAGRLDLGENWEIQSSARLNAGGEILSTASFTPTGWYRTSVPATVVAALVQNKVYPDPGFGMNLRSIPGTSYPIGANFSNLPMSEDSPFRASWWYRTEVQLPAEYKGRNIWLNFSGINYRANIWVNGGKIADTKQVAGAFRTYEFDITRVARPGEKNVLAVEVFAPQPDDLAITWVDWNPAPPDKNMGIWQPVFLTTSGPLALRHPQVRVKLELPALNRARLTVTAEVRNATNQPISGTLRGEIERIRFSQPVQLGPGEKKLVTFDPERFPQLNLARPRVWWPAQMGDQPLYQLRMQLVTGGKSSDDAAVRFGIREITSERGEQGQTAFRVNGERILIRGGGWASDMLLRFSPERQEAEMRYVKDLNLNTIRLEGKLDSDYLHDLADEQGILIMAGWCCCDHWEKWANWKEEDYEIAAESQRSQILRLRNHPSLLVWLNGSDNPPPPRVEQRYVAILKELNWPNPYLSSATQKVAEFTGPTGVKMTGPYEWVPPSYWLLDDKRGGAWSFNTETSAGPDVPPLESLRKMLPGDHLWPMDDVWNYHAGGGQFKNLHVFTQALEARYGQADTLEDYAMKSQAMAYEAVRAMFEGYSRNKYRTTGVIQWMLNDAWPSLIWHLYDYFLMPGGAYFGAKAACRPLNAQYSYDDRSVVLVNSTYAATPRLKVKAAIHDLGMTEKFSKEVSVDAAPDSATRIFTIPEIAGLSTTYFLRLTIENPAGQQIANNFYWLSTKPEVLDWEKSTWYYTPTASYADFTALNSLPKIRLEVRSKFQRAGQEQVARVAVRNPSQHLAFLVRLRVTKEPGGDDVLPILWDDNFFALLPGEAREITARYNAKDIGNAQPVVRVEGWNVASATAVTQPSAGRRK